MYFVGTQHHDCTSSRPPEADVHNVPLINDTVSGPLPPLHFDGNNLLSFLTSAHLFTCAVFPGYFTVINNEEIFRGYEERFKIQVSWARKETHRRRQVNKLCELCCCQFS
jgi:hypothetical protein